MTHKHKKTGEFVDSKSKATWEEFESQMRESLGDTSSIATNNNNEEDSTQKELAIWTKVVGGLTKGRIYGLGSEASSVPTQNMPLTIPQTSSTMQESLEHVEKRIREEVRQEMQKEIQDLKAQMQQLLANYGMSLPSPPPAPLDRGSTTLQNKDT